MKKGILVIFVALMAVAMLATPLISRVQAKKTVVPFSYTSATSLKSTGEVDVKWTPDWSIRIARELGDFSLIMDPWELEHVYRGNNQHNTL